MIKTTDYALMLDVYRCMCTHTHRVHTLTHTKFKKIKLK
jgi:hypothetical protein